MKSSTNIKLVKIQYARWSLQINTLIILKIGQWLGLVGEGLASKLFNYFKDWKLYRVNASISDETHKVPERTWVLDGGGFKILCKSFLYGRCL